MDDRLAELRAERVARLRADRDRVAANVKGWKVQVRRSGRPATSLLADAIADGLAEVDRLEAELEREVGGG